MTTPFASAPGPASGAAVSTRYVRIRGTRARVYQPLERYLAALPADQHAVRLTRRDLHAILGAPIAPVASIIPSWNAAAVAKAFRQRAGFRATRDRHDHSITFTRQARQPLASRPLQEA